MQIRISWLLKKPTDLDLHCLQRQGISGFSRTRVNKSCIISGKEEDEELSSGTEDENVEEEEEEEEEEEVDEDDLSPAQLRKLRAVSY